MTNKQDYVKTVHVVKKVHSYTHLGFLCIHMWSCCFYTILMHKPREVSTWEVRGNSIQLPCYSTTTLNLHLLYTGKSLQNTRQSLLIDCCLFFLICIVHCIWMPYMPFSWPCKNRVARLAQLAKHRSAELEVTGSNHGRTNTQGLK